MSSPFFDSSPKTQGVLAPSLYRQAALLGRHFPSTRFKEIYWLHPDYNRKRDGLLLRAFRPVNPRLLKTSWAYPPDYRRGRHWDLGESRKYFLGVGASDGKTPNFGSFCEYSGGQWLVWPHDHQKTVAFLSSLDLLDDLR